MGDNEKRRQSRKEYENRRRERVKAMPLADQESVKARQRATQAKYRKAYIAILSGGYSQLTVCFISNQEKLRLKADSRRWILTEDRNTFRLFMEQYEDDPGKMPDDCIHRRGHLYHPEDYPLELQPEGSQDA
ncbi:uncharacterized protein EV420DRAFT_1748310 [Desarmillaria tabescens]|uniref:Uncharacterized protein n=1 Tax=Armillaria tabescens TaxID=1929756 RepID=A0AA39N4M5_ARMTA|nr:uncharacterized protein EV420DRAFT_1748310 [Desarmillaria tabescens]KAK0457966.1 hypothetical protein EV420DRAFT_1748310 [Desarmillaria tabescens]